MANIANDTFTESDGTTYVVLNTHTSESGHTWDTEGNTDIVIETAADEVITQATVDPRVFCRISANPPSANYSVEMPITVADDGDFTVCGVGVRLQAGSSGYVAQIDPNAGLLILNRIDSGGNNPLHSEVIDLSTLPVTYNIKVEADGQDISIYKNGGLVRTVQDDTYATAGSAGFVIRSQNSLPEQTPFRISSFTADTLAGTPIVSNVDGDNAVNQYQLCFIDVSNFTETITSVTINAVAVESIPDNDPTDNVIQVRMPGSLATGTYDVVVGGATQSDTISGISYTQTHPVQLPTGAVDSNSILNGQTYDQDGSVYADNPAAPYEITGEGGSAVGGGETMAFTGGYTDWSDAPLANDVDDYLAAPASFTGWMRSDHQRLYNDGTTDSWSVEYQVTDGAPSVFASHRATKLPTRNATRLPTRSKL